MKRCLSNDRFWEVAGRNASEGSQRRFITAFDECFGALVEEAIDRNLNKHRIRDVESYVDARRKTVGARPSFALLELALDIPDEVMSHAMIQEMSSASIDMIYIANVSNDRDQRTRDLS